MKKVAIIPARGGSKRIPKKNIRLLGGKPLIAYSICAAKDTKLFDRIIVSTDSDEIRTIAVDYGAEVPFLRPAEISDDHAVTSQVIIHALTWLSNSNFIADYVCCIYATAPLIRSDDIVKGFRLLTSEGATSCFSVTTFPYPIFRALRINNDGRLEMFWPEYLRTRSQDLPEAYHDAGQFYWAKVNKYLVDKTFLSKDALPIMIPRCYVQDLDTMEDWEKLEIMFDILKKCDNCKM